MGIRTSRCSCWLCSVKDLLHAKAKSEGSWCGEPAAQMAGHGRTDAASKGSDPRRSYLGLSLKNAIFGVFLLCTCVFVLLHNLRYAHLVIRMVPVQQYEIPVIPVREQVTAPHHHNATTKSTDSMDQKLNIGIHSSSPGASEAEDDTLQNIDLSVEENDKDIAEDSETGEPGSSTIYASGNAHLDGTDAHDASVISEETTLIASEDGGSFISTSQALEMKLQNDSTGSNGAMFDKDWDIPRAIPKNWIPSKKCATAEEMGAETVGDTRAASLRVRAMIRDFIAEHGAGRVGTLPGAEFCQRGFVLGQAQEDGFGNNMYKVLTAAGVAVMLNRSLIIAERGGTNPNYGKHKPTTKPAFGDYLDFSNEAFTVREVRRLWAVHGCATKYKRPLIIHTDSLDQKGFRHTRCICDDWTTFTVPILHFKGATGSGAIQLLLKNEHPSMRRAAVRLLGNPAVPSSRPNTFGELFRAFIAPNSEIDEAVQWALKGGPDPDITLHLRMLHSRTKPGPAAASTCINRIRRQISPKQLTRGRRPRVVVVTDTPAIIPGLQKSLGQTVEVVRFNYLAYAKEITNRSEVLSLKHGLPAHNRLRDWGVMPRWVAMVDFFLAARAQTAVISGAYRRVSTTYAQLVAALAAAYTLDDTEPSRPGCEYYSSLQTSLLTSGLASQSGWGHTWRPFGGKLGCRFQATQCARTALMPYAWWDAVWQSPISGDIRKLQGFAGIDAAGQISERVMEKFCIEGRRRPVIITKLQIPSYEEAIAEA